MTRRRWWALALILVPALLGAACGDDDDGGAIKSGDDTKAEDSLPRPTFASGTTMASLQGKGKMVVGVKFDQKGFGAKSAESGKVEGFDVEIAKLVAQAVYGGTLQEAESHIELKEAVSKNREPFIQNGEVDIVVATYTINDARKAVVDFAGPYFAARQDILVKSNDTTTRSIDDLNGKKVCTAKGSTSEKNIRAKAPRADVLLFDTYDQCKEALLDGRVQAVSTDDAILAGLAQGNAELKLVKAPFSEEPYGIGLRKGDQAFRDFLNDRLEAIFRNGQWRAAFERTLGRLGLDVPPVPTVDRYTSSGSTGSTTSSTTGGGTTGGTGSGGTSSSSSSSSSSSTSSSSTTSTTR